MGRFYGEVGYGESVETVPGVHVDQITEISYYGDVTKQQRHIQDYESVNVDLTLRNSISIVADEHAFAHFQRIRYVRWEGQLWTVTDVEVQRPRLILRLGKVYNGPTP